MCNHDIRLFIHSSKERREFFSRSCPSDAPSIEGLLHRVCLDDSHRQPYIVLSYTWESPISLELLLNTCASKTSQQTIKCDGRSLRVRENLHDALLAFQGTTPLFPIWIDALCIN